MRCKALIISALAAAIGLLPAVSSAQPFMPRGGHRPGPSHGMGPHGPGGPGHGPRGWGGPRRSSGSGVAAGIIGFAAGAMIAGAAARAQNAHVQRCLNAYRSYDPETDTFVDRYGHVRRCNL
jgi:hypothetical protein